MRQTHDDSGFIAGFFWESADPRIRAQFAVNPGFPGLAARYTEQSFTGVVWLVFRANLGSAFGSLAEKLPSDPAARR
jgi:hypothetical protein